MNQAPDHSAYEEQLALTDALETGAVVTVRAMLNELKGAEIAHILESSPPKQRAVLWQLISLDREGEVFQELSENLQTDLLKSMDTEEVASLVEGLEADDIADILQQLPDQLIPDVLSEMDSQDRQRVERILPFDEESAGGLMNTDTITVRADLNIEVVLRYLRRHESIPDMTDNIFVVNRNDIFVGVLPLKKLLTSLPNLTVREVMDTDIEAIHANTADSDVAHLFERHDWVSAPVVGNNNELLGRITIDDVVDVIREDADHSLLGLAGLDEEEDTFATIKRTIPRRAIWLSLNLLAVFVSANVINLFGETIEKVVALAILMPIVASMGGVAGSQTLTVIIRGMAMGQISRKNARWLIGREISVATINGVLLALCAGIIATLWFSDATLGIVIGMAMIINLLAASLFAVMIPLTLKRLDIDPALAGGMMITTLTDVIGFLSFLGLAAFFFR